VEDESNFRVLRRSAATAGAWCSEMRASGGTIDASGGKVGFFCDSKLLNHT